MDLKLGAAPEQHADITLELFHQLSPAIDARGLRKLYDEIELPLTRVLARMERTGIRIDRGRVEAALRTDGDGDLAAHRGDPRAGRASRSTSARRSNWASVLFEDLNLPAPVTYGKGKAISTAADVLDELAAESRDRAQGAGVPPAHQAEGHLCGRAAGADRPGDRARAHQLQPGGRGHRAALVVQSRTCRIFRSAPNWAARSAPPSCRAQGWKLLVADYSQIELRLLAHMSGDELLVDAFRNGEDIHTRTAAEVMGVPPMMVTPEARQQRQGGEFRHRLRHQRLRPGRATGHLARRGGEVHQELLRALRGGAALHRRHHRRGAANGRDADAVRARAAHSRRSTAAIRARADSPSARR